MQVLHVRVLTFLAEIHLLIIANQHSGFSTTYVKLDIFFKNDLLTTFSYKIRFTTKAIRR